MTAFRWAPVCAALLLLTVLPARGQESSELDDIRRELESLRSVVEQHSSRLQRSLQVHGYLSQGWMRSSDNNFLTDSDDGSFEFNEAAVTVQGEVSDSLHCGLQLLARDMGELGSNDVVLDWAYLDYNIAEYLGARIGRVKMPVGMYNETRDFDAGRDCILLPQGVYSDLLRDASLASNGMQLYGSCDIGLAGGLSYQAWIGGISVDDEEGGIPLFYEDREQNAVDVSQLDIDYVSGFSFDWTTPLTGLRLNGSYGRLRGLSASGVTTAWAPMGAGVPFTTTMPDYDFRTCGLEYVWRDLRLAGEYQWQDAADYARIGGVSRGRNGTHIDTFYVLASMQLGEAWAAGSYYSEYYGNTKDRDGHAYAAATGLPAYNRWQKDTAVFTRYDVTSNWTLKAELHLFEGTGQTLLANNLDAYGNPRLEKNWHMFLLKASCSF